MKFARKTIVSAAVALSMMMFSSVTAYAVDYGTDPDYAEPDEIIASEGTTPETPAQVVSDSTISDAIADAEEGETVTIYVDEDKAMFTEDGIAAIVAAADAGVEVSIEVDNSTVGAFTMSISNVTEVQAIDLTMDFAKSNKEQKIETRNGSEVTVPKNALVITPAASGSFGMDVTMTLDSSAIGGMDASKVSLYHISDEGRVTKQNSSLKIHKDGTVEITINHASSYVLTDQEMATDDDVSIDSDVDAVVTPGRDDANPITGVALAAVPAMIAAAAAVLSFKKKK